MPHYVFTFTPSVAGCVERVCLFTPWVQNGPALAWQWLQQFARTPDPSGRPVLMFAQNCNVGCTCTNPGGAGTAPNVYCVQKAEPLIDRQQINAPYGSPIGNGHALTMPPLPTKGRDASSPQGMYENMPDCALANNADPMFGDSDGAGGTFSDLDSTGHEVIRQMTSPFPQKVVGGG